jgi:hypothetical protein
MDGEMGGELAGKRVRLTKAERQKNTIEVAKSVEKVREVCAYLHAEFEKNSHVRIGPLLTDRGLDGLTFDAVCYAMRAAGAKIWPSQLTDRGD